MARGSLLWAIGVALVVATLGWQVQYELEIRECVKDPRLILCSGPLDPWVLPLTLVAATFLLVAGALRLAKVGNRSYAADGADEATGFLLMGIRIAVPLLPGLVVLVLLATASQVDTLPPQCLSVFGYGVPCGAGLALGAGAATVGVVGLALWFNSRRETPEMS